MAATRKTVFGIKLKTKLRDFSPRATERPPLVAEVSANFCWWRVSRGQRNGSARPLISIFKTRSRYFSIQIAPQLSSRGWVDPVSDTLLLKNLVAQGNRIQDLWICNQELWGFETGNKIIATQWIQPFPNLIYCELVRCEVLAAVTIKNNIF
jgi:hypothetical protein